MAESTAVDNENSDCNAAFNKYVMLRPLVSTANMHTLDKEARAHWLLYCRATTGMKVVYTYIRAACPHIRIL